jgi:hypothetical protein
MLEVACKLHVQGGASDKIYGTSVVFAVNQTALSSGIPVLRKTDFAVNPTEDKPTPAAVTEARIRAVFVHHSWI